MKKAIEAKNNNSVSQRQAAFGVPKSSLNDKLHEQKSGENGRDQLLDQLVKCYW